MKLSYKELYDATALNKENIEAYAKEMQSFDQMSEEDKKKFYAKGVYFCAHLPMPEKAGENAGATDILNHILHQVQDRGAAQALMSILIGIGIIAMHELRMENGQPVRNQEIYIYVDPVQLDAVNDARRKLFMVPEDPQSND
jgi:hypothetical protein